MPERAPITTEECRRLTLAGRERLEALLRGIHDLTRDGRDEWSAKDHLLHLAVWQARVADWFDEAGRGRTPARPEPGYRFDQIDELNERDWRVGRALTVDDVRRTFDASHARVVALIDRLSGKELNEPDRFPWLGFPAVDAIAGNSYGHYGDHREALEELVRDSELSR
jgi:hypothetical protein